MLPELQRIKVSVTCGTLQGAGGPRTLSRTTDIILDCEFVENALDFAVPKILEGPGPPEPPPSLIHVLIAHSEWPTGYSDPR